MLRVDAFITAHPFLTFAMWIALMLLLERIARLAMRGRR